MQADININSKELIKNRMLKHALTYWGIKNTEDLDPAVKLILEALSLELYNLGNEIRDTQVRILEKVANLLAPDFLTAPSAAHGLLHVCPVEPREILSSDACFFAQRKISSKQNEVLDSTLEVYFTPVQAMHVFDIQVAAIATGNHIYGYDPSFNKQILAKSKSGFKETGVVWLGLRVNTKIESLDDLSCCFDWKNMEPKLAHINYQLLPLAKWYVDEMEINTRPGISYPPPAEPGDAYENIFVEYDLLNLMEKDIKDHYHHKFISVKDTGFLKVQASKKPYPSAFSNAFTESDLQKLSEKLVWMKIVFPAAIRQESLDELYIYTNVFPVMNRQLNDVKYRLKGGSNIIPLRTEQLEQFVSVRTLSDESRRYRAVPYRKKEEEESGTYTLRKGGVERFDDRNAREMISYLLELLRSESSAFSAFGYDFIATTLKEMNQKISLMEQKTKGYISNAAEIPNYIIVKPFEGQDMMYVTYWTTLAEVANNIRAGSKLQQGKGSKVKPDSVILLTATTGGKNRLKPEERLNAFRYGIMTRNRIITREDIRNFCFYELGERISKVEVERGFALSHHSKQAFRRTVDVMITPAGSGGVDAVAWQQLCEQLKSKLKARSGMSSDYRVMVTNGES
jgi:hypothetical protein